MSVFREALTFFDTVGLFDVVLPFLLIFTLVFGVLEKSRILGTEKTPDGKGGPYTKKNLNAMIAFVSAFFFVASAQLVALVNTFVAQIALILVILVMMMILLASFHKQQDNDGFSLEKWKWLMGVVVVAVVLLLLNGLGWLMPLWSYATTSWDSQLMGTVFLFAIIIGFIMFVTSNPNKTEEKAK